MRKQSIIIAALAVALTMLVSGCGNSNGSSENGTSSSGSDSAPVSPGAGDTSSTNGSDLSLAGENSSPESGSAAPVSRNNSDGLYQVKNEDGGVKIVKYLGDGGEVVIPEEIGGKKVVEIGDGAFRSCTGLTSVSIPGCVEDIGDEAFYNCSALRSVTIYDGVREIGDMAFGKTNVRGIYIPPSVDDIGGGAFNNESLEQIEVDENNRGYCGVDGVLYDKYMSKLYCYPCKIIAESFTVPNSVREIEEYAFMDCTGLKTLELPDSIDEIEYGAFDGCTELTVNYHGRSYTGGELNKLCNDD